jgi:hypothetical protein
MGYVYACLNQRGIVTDRHPQKFPQLHRREIRVPESYDVGAGGISPPISEDGP